MTEKDLLYLCDPKNAYKGKSIWIYWTAELYSFGKNIRDYGYFPSFLPLCVYSEHSAPAYRLDPYKHEIETDAPIFLCHSKSKSIIYTKLTGKKSYNIFSPNVFYRRKNKIIQHKNANGTVVFPTHSNPTWESKFDINQYCDDLIKLPKSFQPVTVCLHMHDINLGNHKIYQDKGFNVVTAGNSSDYKFVDRLYEIMKYAKFISSNGPGTIGPLSVEMGIPFFIYGSKSKSKNISDPNFPSNEIVLPSNTETMFFQKLKLSKNFELPVVDKFFKDTIEDFLGLNNGISRIKMCFILWYALFNWIFTFKWILWILRNKKIIKKK